MIRTWILHKAHIHVLHKFIPSEHHLQRLAEKHRDIRQFLPPIFPIEEHAEDTVEQMIIKGRLYLETKQIHEALLCFNKAITCDTQHSWAWHGKGDAHQLVGQYKEACIAYEQAMRLCPKEPYHIAGLANAHHGLGMRTIAESLRAQATQLSPDMKTVFCW